MRVLSAVLVLVVGVAASAAAAAPAKIDKKAVDATQTAGGVTLREIFASRKDLTTHWHLAVEQRGVKYFERDKDMPVFMKQRVDKVMAIVGNRSGRVALVALQIDESSRCGAVKDALVKAWGQPIKVREGTWQWKGDKVDVSQEHDQAGDCTLFLQDLGYDEENDTFR